MMPKATRTVSDMTIAPLRITITTYTIYPDRDIGASSIYILVVKETPYLLKRYRELEGIVGQCW